MKTLLKVLYFIGKSIGKVLLVPGSLIILVVFVFLIAGIAVDILTFINCNVPFLQFDPWVCR